MTEHQSCLEPLDATLVAIYMTACVNDWDKLPPLAERFYALGGTVAQLRGCLRHLIVLAGYGPCLAANLTLQKAKLLPEDTPAKVTGPPGDAFELVYASVTDAVRRKVHSADPVLGEWIRLHLYGDIYSSPGIDLHVKQLLMCARLAQANMGEQLFGHALAALRFGNTRQSLEEAISLAFTVAQNSHNSSIGGDHIQKEALKILDLAVAKFNKDYRGTEASSPAITIINRDRHVGIPQLYEGASSREHLADTSDWWQPKLLEKEAEKQGNEKTGTCNGDGDDLSDIKDDGIRFVWEELDDRNDPVTGKWLKKEKEEER